MKSPGSFGIGLFLDARQAGSRGMIFVPVAQNCTFAQNMNTGKMTTGKSILSRIS
ncbi:hypothetical protein MR764_16895 [Maribellus sp. YY47]|nr:hypothetical protein [Maribellus sp. YY47]